jgi:glycosyltransferase involved in cell wall biosynthesis
MKVALLSYDFGEYCVRLASALRQRADVLLLLPQQLADPHLSILDTGVNFQPFDKPRLRQPGRQIRVGVNLLRHLNAFDPDVLHLQQGHLWFNGFLPLLRRRPLVLTVHDPRHHLGDQGGRHTPQAIIDFGFRRASQVIVHAEQLKQVVVTECGIPPEIVHVVPHIALGTSPSVPPPDDGATILFFGRIWEYKGLEFLIRAEPLITAEVADARIVIAGQGEEFARYRRMMVHPDRFTVYNEYLSDERRDELFQQATVVVLPYVEASQSGVIPLAYTFMKPVVATRVGGLPEMVEDGRTGYLVPPRDERALAAAIVRLLRNKPLCRQLGLNGKRKLDAECAPAVVAGHTLAVYNRALGRRPAATERGRAQPLARLPGMFSPSDQQDRAAISLHRYMVARHWTGHALIGPDPGIRFNYRIGRFVKSYLRQVRWNDDYYYLQGQGYWTLSNWRLFDLLREETYREIAVRCSASILTAQRPDGAWEYPNPEWRGRIATVEGTWASIGLLETYRRTGEASFLTGGLRWHRFLVETIGFQRIGDTLAANYFAHRTGTRVPANSAIVLRFLAELADVTREQAYLEQAGGLLRFFRSTQRASGEFPYAVEGTRELRRVHFQCYQYNAFLCLELSRYYELTRNPDFLQPVPRLLDFLATGVAPDGHAFYACGNAHRAVTYHAAAVAAALSAGARLGIGAYDLADRAYAYVLGRQRPDGGFPYSQRDYRLLSDQRSYPRYLAMILLHLLSHRAPAGSPAWETRQGIIGCLDAH